MRAMLNFDRYEVLTFDCYGTLIDWEGGILGALKPLLAAHQIEMTDDALLELYAEVEADLEKGDYLKYRQVLEAAVQGLGDRLGFTPTDAEKRVLPESVQHWQPFPDTVEALKKLKQKYKLVILSNIDDDLFAGSAKHLQVPFDAIITAEQVQSYKPALNHFNRMLQQLNLSTDQVLHVAQSIYHDIVPARSIGLSTIWVNRRHDRPGFGATPAANAAADITVPDLKTLADMATP